MDALSHRSLQITLSQQFNNTLDNISPDLNTTVLTSVTQASDVDNHAQVVENVGIIYPPGNGSMRTFPSSTAAPMVFDLEGQVPAVRTAILRQAIAKMRKVGWAKAMGVFGAFCTIFSTAVVLKVNLARS